MFARVSTFRAPDADKLMEGFDSVTPQLEQLEGFSHAYFLVDRSEGQAMSITIWKSEDALQASAPKANEMRKTGTERGGGAIESVKQYEIAMTLGAGTEALSR